MAYLAILSIHFFHASFVTFFFNKIRCPKQLKKQMKQNFVLYFWSPKSEGGWVGWGPLFRTSLKIREKLAKFEAKSSSWSAMLNKWSSTQRGNLKSSRSCLHCNWGKTQTQSQIHKYTKSNTLCTMIEWLLFKLPRCVDDQAMMMMMTILLQMLPISSQSLNWADLASRRATEG